MQRRSLLAATISAILLAGPALADPPAAPAAPVAKADVAAPAAPAPAAPAVAAGDFGGPLVANVCLLSRDRIFAQSQVGQAATARLKQLGQRAQANFDGERRKIEGEAKALQSKAPTMPPADVQHRQQQLQARFQATQTEAAQAERELEVTRAKVMGQIEDAVQPIVLATYQTKGCGLLIAREAVLGGNMGNDLTAAVIQGLDAKMTTITFEREHLPPAPGAR